MTLLYQTAVRAHRRRRILRTRARPLSLFRNGADNGMRRQALTAANSTGYGALRRLTLL
jgi:hypothetical protein